MMKKCFKVEFYDFVFRLSLLFTLILIAETTGTGEIWTAKENYSNHEEVKIRCSFKGYPLLDETTDYYYIKLAHRYNNTITPPEHINVFTSDHRYNKDDKTVTITKPNLELGYYEITCLAKNGSETGVGVDLKSIYVGTEPEEVQNFTCVNFAFDKMVCSFDTLYNAVQPQYTLEVRTGNQFAKRYKNRKVVIDEGNYNKKDCKLSVNKNIPSRYECTTTIEFAPYNFILYRVNGLSKKPLNQSFDINLLNVTVPPKVEFDSVRTNISSVEFNFSINESANYVYNSKNYLIFLVSLRTKLGILDQSEYQYEVKKAVGDIFSFKIENLPYPNYVYNVTFRCKMLLSPNSSDLYFSEPTHYTFMTNPTIPYRPPRTNLGAFEIIRPNLGNSNGNSILTIFWEKLEEYEFNGPNFEYDITVYKNNVPSDMKPSSKNHYSATYEIPRGAEYFTTDYRFEILSTNSKGNSPNSSRVVVNRFAFKNPNPIEDVWKVTNDFEANLTWSLQKDDDDLKSFTVYWCNARSRDEYSTCNDSIYFEEIPKHERVHTFNNTIVNYGIAMNYQKNSSGIVWNTCTSRKDKKLEQVKDFKHDPVQKREINLRWSTDCQFKSVINGYFLEYCLLNNISKNCTGKIHNVTLGNKNASHTVKHLKPYSRYKFGISMYRGQERAESSYLTIETKQDAPSCPQDLIVRNVTSSTVYLEWSKPEEMNGEFKFYKVFFNDKKGFNNSDYKSTTATNITLMNLDGNTNYLLYVVAHTVEDSEPSNVVSIKTLIGTPSSPKLADQPFKYQSSNIVANWYAPEKPNGLVDFYEISLGDRVSLVRNLSCTVDICDDPKGMDFKIIAVNVYESHNSTFEETFPNIYLNSLCAEDISYDISQRFTSNFKFYKSVALTNQLPCSRGTPILYVIILAVCIAISFVFFMSFYKIRKMQDIKVVLPPGLGYGSSPIKNNGTNTSQTQDEAESDQTIETNETECSTLTGHEYFKSLEFEEISEKPKTPFYLTNTAAPVIDNFTKQENNSGYIKIQPVSEYIQPNTCGYVTLPDLQKIKNESEYLPIETEESIPTPMMSGYVTPGGNFYK